MKGKTLISKASSSTSFLVISSKFSGTLCLSYRQMFATQDRRWDLPPKRFLKRKWEAMLFLLNSPNLLILTLISYHLGLLAKHNPPH